MGRFGEGKRKGDGLEKEGAGGASGAERGREEEKGRGEKRAEVIRSVLTAGRTGGEGEIKSADSKRGGIISRITGLIFFLETRGIS